MRKITLLLGSIFLLLGACKGTKKITKTVVSDKPNIIIMLADDLGWNDVGYHNDELITPHLDQLAAEGLQINRFYTNKSCTPSRIGLLTGQHPGRFGLGPDVGVIKPNWRNGVPVEVSMIPEMLAEAGYENRACIGKWHLGHSNVKYHPLNRGFTYFYGLYGGMVGYFYHKRKSQLDWHRDFEPCHDKGYSTDLMGNEAVHFIEDQEKEKPFFLYVSFNAPHVPLEAKMEHLEMYGYDPAEGTYSHSNDEKVPNKILGRGNTARQTYTAMVTAMDEAIGRILDAVERKEMSENTLILFLSDHGATTKAGGNNEPLRAGKGYFYEGGVRVPAIIKWPKSLPQGKTESTPISYTDVFATLQEISKAPGKYETDGRSVLPILKGDIDSPERYIYLGREAIIKKEWKLVYDELYNINYDLSEEKNLAEEFPIIYTELKTELDKLAAQIEKTVPIKEDHKVQPNWKMLEY